MRKEDLELFGLTEKDAARITESGIRKLMEVTSRVRDTWSLTKQDRREYENKLAALRRMLDEVQNR